MAYAHFVVTRPAGGYLSVPPVDDQARCLRSEPIHTLRGRNPEEPLGSRRGYYTLQQSTHDLSRTPVCQNMIIAHRTGKHREPPLLCGRHAVAAHGPKPPVWNLDGVYFHIVQ